MASLGFLYEGMTMATSGALRDGDARGLRGGVPAVASGCAAPARQSGPSSALRYACPLLGEPYLRLRLGSRTENRVEYARPPAREREPGTVLASVNTNEGSMKWIALVAGGGGCRPDDWLYASAASVSSPLEKRVRVLERKMDITVPDLEHSKAKLGLRITLLKARVVNLEENLECFKNFTYTLFAKI